MAISDYKVDNLFLLVGNNTLPNYVSAQLLADSQTQIFLVYSEGTSDQRKWLNDLLSGKGYQQITPIEVEEANPKDIRNQVLKAAHSLTGTIGLNYTGGTKTMAVHAYNAIQQEVVNVTSYFSYLDARTLSMVIEGSGLTYPKAIKVNRAVKLSVDELLRLHGIEAKFSTEPPLWPKSAAAIAKVHANQADHKRWQRWIAKTFFKDIKEREWPQVVKKEDRECPQVVKKEDRECPQVVKEDDRENAWKQWVRQRFILEEYKRRQWKTKGMLAKTPFELPDSLKDVATELAKEANFALPITMREIMKKGGFRKAEKFGKWFEGLWLESFVLAHALELKNKGVIDSIAANIDTSGTPDFEFDVAMMRGYQLFALSCTTSDNKGLCKSKLFEAVSRAEQMGGAEARVGLVTCFDNPSVLLNEVKDLLGEKRVRVFGRQQLLGIKGELETWLNQAG